ncbi:hypothetical protein [Hyphococcus sp.]|uniref:hypothetical protein n=1 Tax=Hyphococcus sp. TaxID=2038636 RepID=UPI0020833333|nr:MAG: hypothetical protein DHS20C04_04750 [Marinicaulis sp.]
MITPVHFALDLEPDERLPEIGAASFDNAGVALRAMMQMREKLQDKTGLTARFGWYVRMDRHIAELYGGADAITQRYQRELELAFEAGDEIGLHIHVAERDKRGCWRVNYADEKLVAETVDDAFDQFLSFFGRPCKAVRMGDMWISKSCMRHLARKGLLYDVSMETGLRSQQLKAHYPGTSSKGRRPSLVAAPLKPFQPFAGEDEIGEMWALPLSSHPRNDYHWPGMWLNSANTMLATGFRRRRARDVLRPQANYSSKELEAAIDCAISEPGQPGLCVAVRNFGAASRIEAFFDILCKLTLRRKIQFCTPAEYVRLAKLAR